MKNLFILSLCCLVFGACIGCSGEEKGADAPIVTEGGAKAEDGSDAGTTGQSKRPAPDFK